MIMAPSSSLSSRAAICCFLLLSLLALLLPRSCHSFVILPTTTATVGSIAIQKTTQLAADAAAAAKPPAPGGSSSNQQAAYGETLDLPDSYVRCGKCQTVYAITENDLGNGKGRRLECSVCQHSWFQSKDRVMKLNGDCAMVPLPQRDLDRIEMNMQEGKSPRFLGEKKLYVGNIAFESHEDDLYELFEQCGLVGDVSLVKDEQGKNRGFGFITMRTAEAGDKAIDELDGASVRGRNIAVRESNN